MSPILCENLLWWHQLSSAHANEGLLHLRVKCIILLHLFSGHRRSGDVQDEFEKLQSTSSFPLLGISVDVVISMKYGNMLDPATQGIFISAVKEGLIGAIIAGPPCETWSQAREQYYRDQRGPRPLRTVPMPQGMSQLKLRELTQLLIGNDLLGAAFMFAYTAWISGCFMMLEHPKEPQSAYSPSIWKLPIAIFLQRQPNVRRITIQQGLFGAASAKPTDLLCIHATDDVQDILARHRTRTKVPYEVSIGKNDKGRYKTQALKAYPPALCKAIAQAAYAHVLARGFDSPCDALPPDVKIAVDALTASIGASTLGPDFCRAGMQVTTHDWRSAKLRQ